MANPNVLRAIAGNPAAYPDSPASPVQRVPDKGGGAPAQGDAPPPPPPEPIALHDAASKVKEQMEAARAALEDLQAQAEMAEMIDPDVEAAISKAADELGEVDDALADCVEKLGEARKDHEDLMSGGDDK